MTPMTDPHLISVLAVPTAIEIPHEVIQVIDLEVIECFLCEGVGTLVVEGDDSVHRITQNSKTSWFM